MDFTFYDIYHTALTSGISIDDFWKLSFFEYNSLVEFYSKNIEYSNIVLRELYALTYNINSKKQKRASALIPFSIDHKEELTEEQIEERLKQQEEFKQRALKAWQKG